MTRIFAALVLALAIAGTSHAAKIDVSGEITQSTTWTADNTYNLTDQVYVMPGATLTIEAGTVVASDTTANGAGSLAVTRGAKIYVLGTKDAPVIMTSSEDVATWDADPTHPTGGDPTTGIWRESANEWGNLTIMGNALVSKSSTGAAQDPVTIVTDDDGVAGGSTSQRVNTAIPDGLNQSPMEGLTAAFTGDSRVYYGGNDDDDNSGSISYLSMRYGGRVVGLGNELNGLSLGGIGRSTDINHVEIMNNVDDGIEIWGGTVFLKNVAVWNIGDDSFDVDQGWRGGAQFVLIVQGHSLDASQGSGVGDNGFETDGAENSDAQPVTTVVIANATFIGNPGDGDGATVWRDNANVQYWNSIFMDCGEKVVRPDGDDGDGAQGYGHNGTLDFATRWSTPYTTTSTVNAASGAVAGDFNHPATLYQTQAAGNLIGFYNSIFYNNSNYTDFDIHVPNPAANNNIKEPTNSPIVNVTRGAPVIKGGKVVIPATSVNPLAANDAIDMGAGVIANGPFAPVQFAGAFSSNNNWLLGWAASTHFGLLTGGANVAGPAAKLALHTTTISFDTTAGVNYTVEAATVVGNKVIRWDAVDSVVGDGSTMIVADVLGGNFDAGKLYRVVVQ